MRDATQVKAELDAWKAYQDEAKARRSQADKDQRAAIKKIEELTQELITVLAAAADAPKARTPRSRRGASATAAANGTPDGQPTAPKTSPTEA